MIGRLIKLVILVVIAGAAYLYFQPEASSIVRAVTARWDVLRKGSVEAQELQSAVSAELADKAALKLDRIRDGSDRETFTTDELQSLLQFRYQQLLPGFVSAPRVQLMGDHVSIRVRVPIERLPGADDLGDVIALLPDTTDLDIRGTVLPSDDGHIAFAVDGLTAQRIPLPARLIPAALDMLGREDEPGLPRDAIRVPLPPGARSAYVRADLLVLLSRNGN